ncbi:MAG: 30S ribosomal protein S15 [Elusimicrobia bacterium]|nr:30S ribosomal protein S15 [Elusimicrobiota bacterium]
MITKEQKKELIEKFRTHPGDSGSEIVQAAILTARINYLAGHFKSHPKDFTSKRGFLKLVGQRRRLINYLKNNNRELYIKVVEGLGLK